jgi:hypothetical protein
MKKLTIFTIIFLLLAIAFSPQTALAGTSTTTIPTFSITGVVKDTSVTIYTYNFPASDTFDVLMNYIGTKGVNGIKVATINSGSGGSFSATFSIPSSLKGLYQIAIRLQSNKGSGYYAYNWFYNNTTGSSGNGGSSGYSGIPTFSITAVVKNTSVTILTNNFPKNDSFDVLMNYIGTQGIDGIKVATIDSGAGGAFTATFPIPVEMKGQKQIAIRLQSNTGSGYYAYNWFYNKTTSSSGNGGSPSSGYSGIPTFSITAVVKNTSVTILTNNFPKNDSFDVLMNYIGTKGINGIKVATINSGDGGAFSASFPIPSSLAGQYQIAIRMQSNSGSGYYAYNWFYNNTTK